MEKILEKPQSFCKTYHRKPGSESRSTHYCPGCGHGIMHKLVAEAMDELGMRDNTVLISPVGCSVFAYYYFSCGNLQAAHGRAPAVGTGVTRANPDNFVISYQGDGDLAAIGTAEIIHAANRGEKMTVFFINNSIYGMTGGQMAPTSLIGQKTTTSPFGRTAENEGYPMKMAEMISTLEAPVYVTRVSTHDIKHIMKTRAVVKKALKAQVDGKGFSFVEVLSQCPSGWKVTPDQSADWMAEHVFPYFPLGLFKDEIEQREPYFKKPWKNTVLQVKQALGIETVSGKGLPQADLPENASPLLRIKTAGFGGQGVLLLGMLLSKMATAHNYNVTWLPSYGPEMRGGTANCSVIFNRKPIGSPAVEEMDLLVAMNGPSLEKFIGDIKEGGVLFYNASIIEDPDIKTGVQVFGVPATQLAEDAGHARAANVVMLGAFLAYYDFFSEEATLSILDLQFQNEKIREINRKAFLFGRDFVRKNKKR